ncbi:coiled-coil domain-containing protein 112-like [Schistocerca piceifrons]|uniref:coiled-coil domain-containing protein 112-like n=1 Tax=Schistocerca piceifrons TaxID=274613 RepID=UPI001F5F9234|nr:coiled-coil domain-containing protein 112-like [Schistocerca piceifrons]
MKNNLLLLHFKLTSIMAVKPAKVKEAENEMSNTDFICEAVRLKVQHDFLQKSVQSILNNMKIIDRDVATDLEAYVSGRETKRLEDLEAFQNSLLAAMDTLVQLRFDISTEDRIRSIDLSHFRTALLELEKQLTRLKEHIDKELECLVEEEEKLWNELQDADLKIDEWSKPLDIPHVHAASKVTSMLSIPGSGVQPEVRAFHKFLAKTGGHSGGWDEDDHLAFLRIRTKHQGKQAFMEEVHDLMPDISREDIMKHEEWYCQYEKLRNEQRQAIEVWRNEKSQRSSQKCIEQPPRPQILHRNPEDAADKKQKIEEWKKAKELQQQLDEERKRVEKERQLQEWKRKKERQAQQKAKIEQQKEERLEKQREAVLERQLRELFEIEQRAAVANKMLKAFRQQDQEYVLRRLSWKQRERDRKEDCIERQERLKRQVSVSAERDPQRLLTLTEGWRNRLACKDLDRPPKSAPPLHLRNMPHLAVPSWRKTLQ